MSFELHESGKVRIWDTTQKEHLLKYEYQPLSGCVKDVAWSPDSKRLVIGGDGRERFGAAIGWDTGTNIGDISSHTKAINSVDYRPVRPFRVITASEDTDIGFFEGPPFKLKFQFKDHTRFCQAARYSPDGELFATGAMDGKIFLFDGKTGENVGELPSHAGGVYALSFSPDGKKLLSASGDKSCRVYDVAERKTLREFTMGDRVQDQQVSCLWTSQDVLISVSVSGYINYLDYENPQQPSKIIRGHKKSIQHICKDVTDSHYIYSTSYDGYFYSGEAVEVSCSDEARAAVRCLTVGGGVMAACLSDHVIGYVDDGIFSKSAIKATSFPVMMAHVKDGIFVTACSEEIVVHRADEILSIFKDGEEYFSVASNGEYVAVGTGKDVRIYTMDGNHTLSQVSTLAIDGSVKGLSFSNCGNYLAACGGGRSFKVASVADFSSIIIDGANHHTARVLTCAWSPSGTHVATAGLDNHIFIWNLEKKLAPVLKIKGAHQQYHVSCLLWLDDTSLVSAASDSCIKKWKVNL